ncbi:MULTISPECIES: CAP domain-containing protein [unclassified Streptomyces]|uniref:CAP domain-containing protein n=1 Tax=unclassified Streptomyces TaxID=2593676 RepID=UPI0033DF3CAA
MTGTRRAVPAGGFALLLAAMLACPSAAAATEPSPPDWPPPAPYEPSAEAPPWSTPLAAPEGHPAFRAGSSAHVVAEINRHRAGAGCAPVRLRASLSRSAREHSADMSDHERLTHLGTDGSRPLERMGEAGYRPRRAGEVIAAGPRTPEAAVRAWMRSPSHRAVVLSCPYTDAGVGVTRGSGGPWWTLDLAARR